VQLSQLAFKPLQERLSPSPMLPRPTKPVSCTASIATPSCGVSIVQQSILDQQVAHATARPVAIAPSSLFICPTGVPPDFHMPSQPPPSVPPRAAPCVAPPSMAHGPDPSFHTSSTTSSLPKDPSTASVRSESAAASISSKFSFVDIASAPSSGRSISSNDEVSCLGEDDAFDILDASQN
jgi:hypothetical protein